MRLLKRQETSFAYMPYLGKQEILDNGRHTGRYGIRYGGRETYRGNVALPTGYVQATWFGIDSDYTHILLMDDPKAPIREEGIIEWRNDTYLIRAVRPSDNFLSIAMRKVTADEAAALKKALESGTGGVTDGEESHHV